MKGCESDSERQKRRVGVETSGEAKGLHFFMLEAVLDVTYEVLAAFNSPRFATDVTYVRLKKREPEIRLRSRATH